MLGELAGRFAFSRFRARGKAESEGRECEQRTGTCSPAQCFAAGESPTLLRVVGGTIHLFHCIFSGGLSFRTKHSSRTRSNDVAKCTQPTFFLRETAAQTNKYFNSQKNSGADCAPHPDQ